MSMEVFHLYFYVKAAVLIGNKPLEGTVVLV